MILGCYLGEFKQLIPFFNDKIYKDVVNVYKYGNCVQFVSKNTGLFLGIADISTIEGKYKLFEKIK